MYTKDRKTRKNQSNLSQTSIQYGFTKFKSTNNFYE